MIRYIHISAQCDHTRCSVLEQIAGVTYTYKVPLLETSMEYILVNNAVLELQLMQQLLCLSTYVHVCYFNVLVYFSCQESEEGPGVCCEVQDCQQDCQPL